ncbi:hypothetical protein [Pseudolabrys sp.]|uniref:hypothetical protein n=1 Tax=Pseudolabrys sp. TaxID=1960880 RepID=UPI003D1115AD
MTKTKALSDLRYKHRYVDGDPDPIIVARCFRWDLKVVEVVSNYDAGEPGSSYMFFLTRRWRWTHKIHRDDQGFGPYEDPLVAQCVFNALMNREPLESTDLEE